jgi:hypothetical protein
MTQLLLLLRVGQGEEPLGLAQAQCAKLRLRGTSPLRQHGRASAHGTQSQRALQGETGAAWERPYMQQP